MNLNLESTELAERIVHLLGVGHPHDIDHWIKELLTRAVRIGITEAADEVHNEGLFKMSEELLKFRDVRYPLVQETTVSCPRCSGNGWCPVSVGYGMGVEQEQCEACLGTGRVAKTESANN